MNEASFFQTVKTSHSYHLVTIKPACSLQLFAAKGAKGGWRDDLARGQRDRDKAPADRSLREPQSSTGQYIVLALFSRRAMFSP
jgi:hypothetical protein